jgi:hypothetical protein
MDSRITKEQLRKVLATDMERLLDEVAKAVNEAKAGHIMDHSEELVRDAAGVFRQKLFEKALELRSQREAFSPGAQSRRSASGVEEQGHTDHSRYHR